MKRRMPAKAKTMRERMEAAPENPVCAACHTIMDPIGFSLENFDLVGKWREMDGKTPIDATAEMVDGTKLDGPASLRRALLERSDMFVTVAIGKAADLCDGTGVTTATTCRLSEALHATAADNNYRFSSLVLGVVKSEPFQMRRTEQESS